MNKICFFSVHIFLSLQTKITSKKCTEITEKYFHKLENLAEKYFPHSIARSERKKRDIRVNEEFSAWCGLIKMEDISYFLTQIVM